MLGHETRRAVSSRYIDIIIIPLSEITYKDCYERPSNESLKGT